MRLDIFCRVIDNYGDAGVAWRLARELATEHGARVTLWLDAMPTLARIVPGLAPHARDARCADVRIRALDDAGAGPAMLPDAVIEAFGCGLPQPWLAAMSQAARQPVWVNLEYLSAEPWIEQSHGIASPNPRLPLTRYFYFPGFSPRSGGLLRERGLIARRDAVRGQARAARLPAPLQPLVAPVLEAAGSDAVVVSLFCYPNAALTTLLDAWRTGGEPLVCLVPEGVACAAIGAWAGTQLAGGAVLQRDALSLVGVPFVSQDDYDRVLWTCDANFVRGEDSFVRAQWATPPFVWQAYPQDDAAHRVKVGAFLDRYLDGSPEDVAAAVRSVWHAWNAESAEVARHWIAFRKAAASLARHNGRWAARLAGLPELAAGLLEFCGERL
jgi:uncharacterized repeat protein (TIGR03837 family)